MKKSTKKGKIKTIQALKNKLFNQGSLSQRSKLIEKKKRNPIRSFLGFSVNKQKIVTKDLEQILTHKAKTISTLDTIRISKLAAARSMNHLSIIKQIVKEAIL